MGWKMIFCVAVLWGIFAIVYETDYFPEWLKDLLKEFVNHMSFNLRQSSSYDPYYAMFVLQWPTSVCIFEVIEKRKGRGYSATQADCRFPPQQLSWTIHGIWNSRSSGSRCSGKTLQRSHIENITLELNQRWVQVRKYYENFNFWEYEWNKHGTCLLDHPNLNEPYKYFQQAVNWHRLYDPTSALIACGMPPDNKKTYNNIKMIDCLKERLNIRSRIILATRNDYTYRNGTVLLREIRICFDKEFALTDCERTDPYSIDFVYPHTVENI